MGFDFLTATYRTERLKVLSVWAAFRDEDLRFRPHPEDHRGRSVLEQMIHQCASEDGWFKNMLGIDVTPSPLPGSENRLEFIRKYSEDSSRRAATLAQKSDDWFTEEVSFFSTRRERAWVLVRRIAHTAHHRGQQTSMLRMLNRELHSTYGPTADTGGLPANAAPTIYPYASDTQLVEGEAVGGRKTPLPGPGGKPVTERP